MTRRLLGLAAAFAVAVLAAGCDEAPPTAPAAGPSFARAPSPLACTFTGNPSLSNASNAYFTNASDQKKASDFISAMQTAFGTTTNYVAARPSGFGLLSLVGQVSRVGGGSSPAAGGQVVRQAVQCMFDILGVDAAQFPGWPAGTQWDFASALTKTTGGASYVRRTSDGTNTAVIAADATGNISGVGPSGTKTWSDILSNDVLIYGNPVTNGYDWKLIPNTTSFNTAVVALCRANSSTDMVHQEGVGVIGFSAVRAAQICATTPQPTALRFGPLGRLAQFAARLFTPASLQATTLLSTIGGSATRAKGDEFTSFDLPSVVLTVGSPSGSPAINKRFSLAVNVKTPDGEPAGGITVQLSATTNNGTGTGIFQIADGTPDPIVCDPARPYISTPSATTLATVAPPGGAPAPTDAVWNNNLCFSKTGGLFIIANSFADGNTSQAIGHGSSARINVKP